MSKADYYYFEDPGEVEYQIENLINYIKQAEWELTHEEVDIHIQAIKKQLRFMGGDYEYLADECNSISDALHLSGFSNHHIDPFLDVLRACYALKEYILPDHNKVEALEYAGKLEMAEKAVVLELVWFVRVQEKRRSAKAGAESVKARRKKTETRDQALVEKARHLISNGTKAHEITGILSGLNIAAGLSKKQIRNILQNNGVLQKRTQKGK